uniref:Nudix hydrolase domain-containing protein n=1 Tax=viral metagenome TaxID=1070528 RepID=A0A6C0IS70_9ZZZZ
MGASLLPATIINGQVYFLFGKERDYDENPGWSDFGGGTDGKESFIETAIREGGEELTGFLGDEKHIKKLLTQHGNYHIDYKSEGFDVYRCHIFPMEYDPFLEMYYNNNQAFLQKRLDKKVIRDSKIFEKQQIKWFSFNDIKKNKKQFRKFYQNIIELILKNKDKIINFVLKNNKKKYITHKQRYLYKKKINNKKTRRL